MASCLSPSDRLIVWGSYDLSKPRVRLLLSALERLPLEVHTCHAPIWEQVRDKSQLTKWGLAKALAGTFISYPKLIWRYLRLPRHATVLVLYMGQFDVWMLWIFARLRGARLVWDVFISLYDTTVCDREKYPKGSLIARLLYQFEKWTLRLADRPFSDTATGARYLEKLFHLPQNRVGHVWVGVEEERFSPLPPKKPQPECRVLFYGQFIPLHGITTIIKAARKLEKDGVIFPLIGTGQEAKVIDAHIEKEGITNVKRIQWVPYEDLIKAISEADICLGIFGTSAKAGNVIPNKVFQILATGRPLITADSPAVRELVEERFDRVLVPPGDAEILADAILTLRDQLREQPRLSPPITIGLDQVAQQLNSILGYESLTQSAV